MGSRAAARLIRPSFRAAPTGLDPRMKNPRILLFPLFVLLIAAGIYVLGPKGGETPRDPGALEVTGDADPVHDDRLDGPGKVDGPQGQGPERKIVEASSTKPDGDPDSYTKALGGLRGRILWKHDKKPLVGLEVQAIEARIDSIIPSLDSLMELAQNRRPAILKGKTKTDEEGRFEIPGLSARAILLLLIGRRTEAQAYRFVDRTPATGELVDLGDILLEERGSATGRVLDREGKPVADARVRIADIPGFVVQFGIGRFDPKGLLFMDPRMGNGKQVLPMPSWVEEYYNDLPFPFTTTDKDGRYEIRGVRPGKVSLLVQDLRYPVYTKQIRVRAGRTTKVRDIKLREGQTIVGRVLDGEGEGVKGVLVTGGTMLNMVPVALLPRPVTTDAEGNFKITGAEKGKTYLAYKRHEQGLWTTMGPLPRLEGVEIRFPKAYSAEFTVIDERGTPVREASFGIGPALEAAFFPGLEQWMDSKRHIHPAPNKAGTWLLQDLLKGKYRLLIRAKGHALALVSFDIGKERKPLVFTLAKAPNLRFEVKNQRGQPVHAARVYWQVRRGRAAKQQALSPMPVLLGKTGPDGVLETDKVEIGANKFFVRHPAYAMGHSGDQKAQVGIPIRIRLQNGGKIVGKLTENGRPPENSHTIVAELRWQAGKNFGDAIPPRFTVPLPDGSFHFANLEAGDWRVQVIPRIGEFSSADAMFRMMTVRMSTQSLPSQTVKVRPDGVTQLRLELAKPDNIEGTGSIEGTVRINGKPAESTVVRTWSGSRRVVPVDATGNFALRGLKDGNYYLQVEKSDENVFGGNQLWSGSVQVKNGGMSNVNLDLRATSLRIQVLDPNGEPLGGVMVALQGFLAAPQQGAKSRGSTRVRQITDGEGVALFEAVPEGSFSAQISSGRREFVLPKTKFDVRGNATIRKSIRAVPAVRVSGVVKLDFEGLSAEEKKLAESSKPSWVSVNVEGDWVGDSISFQGAEAKFEFKGLVPGRHTVTGWGNGGVSWRAKDFDATLTQASTTLTMKPDKNSLKRILDARKKAKSKGLKKGRK